jgi:hypothetical protein
MGWSYISTVGRGKDRKALVIGSSKVCDTFRSGTQNKLLMKLAEHPTNIVEV